MKLDVKATAALTITTALGAYLASEVFQKKETRKGVSIAHGALAATGLGLLAFSSRESGWKRHRGNLTLLGLAALGGATLIFKDLTGRPVPLWLTAVHGAVATGGLIWTGVGALKSPQGSRAAIISSDISHTLH